MATTKKVTDLTALTTATGDDLLYIVNDPSGTPGSRKITVTNFTNSIRTANTSTTGVVKVGNNLTINASGHVSVNLDSVSFSINPATDNTYSLGNSTHQWQSLYVTSNTIYIGGTPLSISANGSLVVNNEIVSGGTANTGYITFDGNRISTSNNSSEISLAGNTAINILSDSYAQLQYNANTLVDGSYGSNSNWVYVDNSGIAAETFDANGNYVTSLTVDKSGLRFRTTDGVDSHQWFFDANTATLAFPDGTTQSTAFTTFDPFTQDANGQIYLNPVYYAEDPDQGSADFIDTNVALTRANQYGLFNALVDYPSPQGTLWNSDGWGDLTNVQNRKFITFFASANGKLGVNVLNKFFIMKDTINDKYYKIQFTVWQQGGGGNFTYTRQQINGVTGANIGSPVTFAKTGSGQHDDIDTDVSITRNSNQGIYNVALEEGWNNTQPDTPTFTEWNADGWQDLSNVKNRTYTDLINCAGRYGHLHGQELVMHDIANDKYYTFKFSGWQAGGNGGAFSYTRKLINTSVFFTREDSDTNEVVANVDNIAPGISFARGSGGIIYNADAEEGWSDDFSPLGTMWNADGWDDLSDLFTRQYVSLWSTFKQATGKVILDQDYIMHDTINDEYWAIKFTRWQQAYNQGGPNYPGFSYVRRKLKSSQQRSGLVFADGSIQNKAIKPQDIGVAPQKKTNSMVRYLNRDDIGKQIYIDNSDYTQIYIPDASRVMMPLGATITIVNRSGVDITIQKENDYESGSIFLAGTSRSNNIWTIKDTGGSNVITLRKIADYWDNGPGEKKVDWALSQDGVKNIESNGYVIVMKPSDGFDNKLAIEPTADYDIHLYEATTNGAVTLGRYGATNFRVYGPGGDNNGGHYGNDIRAELNGNASFSIASNAGWWRYNADNTINFPQQSSSSRTGSGEVFKFANTTYQKIIATPNGEAGRETVERLVISGGDGFDTGEGGDIYLWAGRSGANGGSGGDIKVDAGQAYSGAEGGTIKIRGGSSDTGTGGFIEIRAGTGATNAPIYMYAGGNQWTYNGNGSITLPINGDIKNSDGYSVIKSIPQNLQDTEADYTLALSDAGKHVYKNDGAGYSIAVPEDAVVNFEVGTAVTIVSGNSNTYIYPANGDATAIWGAGFNQANTSWYIPDNSMATLLKIAANKWMLSGAGLDLS